jgi:DNA polymerase III epsilon subunit-like protein
MGIDPEPRADLYFSVDIETDGPIPGCYSMLSFALVKAGRFDGHSFERADERAPTFYAELKPISDRFDPEAMRVNGMDRDALAADGQEPKDAMRDAARWVLAAVGDDRPVLVAYPVAFDWAFLFWYFIRWCGDSPFGYSSCLDIRTLYKAKARTVHDRSGKQSMPAWLLSSTPHTHNALDDAREQAELFANVFEYVLDLRGPGSVSPQSVLQAGRS